MYGRALSDAELAELRTRNSDRLRGLTARLPDGRHRARREPMMPGGRRGRLVLVPLLAVALAGIPFALAPIAPSSQADRCRRSSRVPRPG